MLAFFSEMLLFLRLSIFFHISYARMGTAFKTSRSAANPQPLISSQKAREPLRQTAWQVRSHERPGHERNQPDTDESDEQKKSTAFWNVGCIAWSRLMKQKLPASHCKQEAGCKPFHSILSIYSAGHESCGP